MKIPLAVPNLSGNEAAYLQDCIDSTFVSSVGAYVDKFERAIADVSGTEDAVVVSSGTVALQMALQGLGIGEDDLVIIPTLTFIATANAVRHTGAQVWIADVEPSTWTIDLELVREAILKETDWTEDGRRHRATGRLLRAIMPVMVMGASIDFEKVAGLAREFGLKVVVDAAAALGARVANDAPLGSADADALCYSFNGNKIVTSGGGGAVVSRDLNYLDRVRHLTTTGRVGANYDHDIVAYNHRMTNMQAAVGVAQLERLDAFLSRKREVHEVYASMAERFRCLEPFPVASTGRSIRWLSGVYYTGANLGLCDAFRSHMNEAGIDLRKFWKPIHLQLPYQGSPATRMPVADDLWLRIFPLPCSTHITDEQIAAVVSSAESFWKANDA